MTYTFARCIASANRQLVKITRPQMSAFSCRHRRQASIGMNGLLRALRTPPRLKDATGPRAARHRLTSEWAAAHSRWCAVVFPRLDVVSSVLFIVRPSCGRFSWRREYTTIFNSESRTVCTKKSMNHESWTHLCPS